MAVKSYKDLIVWQKAIELTVTVYEYTKIFPKDEIYGLRQQMRRAAVSIPSNIAEGQCRNTTKDFLNFLAIAHGSLGEVETQVIIAERLSYFSAQEASNLTERISEIGKLLHGLKKSLSPLTTNH